MSFLIVIALICLLTLLHEGGHLLGARLLGIKIYKLGFAWFPAPHPYVAVQNTPNVAYRRFFYLSGIAVTVFLFILCWVSNLIAIKEVYYAFGGQFLIETNPVYSDLTLMQKNPRDYFKLHFKLNFHKMIHILAWVMLFYILFSSFGLKNLLNH